MAKVSVVIPTFNRAELLRSAIISVLNQTFHDFELIVVDDASHDHTPEIISEFKDEKIKYIRHGTNKQISASRNTGVLNSHGSYIAFLDDDDEWLPEKLRLQVDLLENSPPTTGAVYTGFYKIDKSSGKTVGEMMPDKRGYIFNDLIKQNQVGTSTVLLKKGCFAKVGLFDESINFGEDYDMWIRISKEFQFDYVKEPLVKYYIHESKLSANHEAMIKGIETVNRKYEQFFSSDRKKFSDRYHRLGVFYCLSGETGKGREALLKAIRLYPFDARYYFRFALSLLGAAKFKRASKFRDKLGSRTWM